MNTTTTTASSIEFRVHVETYISEFCRAIEAIPKRGAELLEQAHRNIYRSFSGDDEDEPTTWVSAKSSHELHAILDAAVKCRALDFVDVVIETKTDGLEAWAGYGPPYDPKLNGHIRFSKVEVDQKLRVAVDKARDILAGAYS